MSRMLTDQQIFDNAVYYARQRAYLRSLAQCPDRERRTDWSRQKCMVHANKAEARVVDLAIISELRSEWQALDGMQS